MLVIGSSVDAQRNVLKREQTVAFISILERAILLPYTVEYSLLSVYYIVPVKLSSTAVQKRGIH